MANKNAEKVRRRKDILKKSQTAAVSSRFNSYWFWLLFIALLLISGYLIYQSFTNDPANQLVKPIITSTIFLLLVLVWYLPKFYVRSLHIESENGFEQERELLKLEDDTRKTFAQIVGGAVLLGSLLFSYNTFRLQQEGQFTDRFTKAVEQIGDDRLEVRLGGLYALERIAKDSPKDHWTVMEILSAYIREKAKREEKSANENNNNINVSDKINNPTEMPTDIQAALTIIGRRKIEQDLENVEIVLIRTNLTGAVLSKANLYKVNFFRADWRCCINRLRKQISGKIFLP